MRAIADDAALVRAVAHGSEEALAALYDRHVDGIHAVALRLTNDRQLAEEVVQETFLALWNRAELFDPALASLATWLRTIARNRTVDRLRAAGRRPPLVPLPGHGDEGEPDAGFDRVGPDAVVIGGAAGEPGPGGRGGGGMRVRAVVRRRSRRCRTWNGWSSSSRTVRA